MSSHSDMPAMQPWPTGSSAAATVSRSPTTGITSSLSCKGDASQRKPPTVTAVIGAPAKQTPCSHTVAGACISELPASAREGFARFFERVSVLP